jgi:sulfide:quinone oxidoreductase
MAREARRAEKLRVVIAGAGVAALECALALAELAPGRTDMKVIAPNAEFFNRPMTVREPFGYARARCYPLASILEVAGASQLTDELSWVDPVGQTVHTKGERTLDYDALVLALGARAVPRYEHAMTIDDRRLDDTMHGLIQDVEAGYTRSLAFISPGRMAWPLPMYELALMTAGRAYDMGEEVAITIVSPEDSPLAIFGSAASAAVGERLARARIETVNSAYAEVPSNGNVVINPGERHLRVDRVVALPELFGPPLRGVPLGTHGFVRVDQHGQVAHAGPIYAAGDVTEFPVKHGGLAAQQADAVAESIAARAGARLTPRPFDPVIQGILLTDAEPLYLTAKIAGGHGFSSEVSDTPFSPPGKTDARYLAPVLARADSQDS